MRVKLIQGYNSFPVGRVLNLGDGVAQLLIQNKKAVPYDPDTDPDEDSDHDLDDDGKDEGGEDGTNKALDGPPKPRKKKRRSGSTGS